MLSTYSSEHLLGILKTFIRRLGDFLKIWFGSLKKPSQNPMTKKTKSLKENYGLEI